MMAGFYTLPVGSFVHFDMPYCGYGVVVDLERSLNDEGQPILVTHILWEGNQWSEINDLKIPLGDPLWRVVLAQLPRSTVMAGRVLWKQLMLDRGRRDKCERCSGLSGLQLQ